MTNDNSFDAVLIGAGPAGSAAAAILAGYGHRVLILEREKFPRYHIGESLLPFTFQPLQRLGLIDKMRASAFVKKYSVQFVSPSGRASQPFYFFNRYDRDTVAQTWQVLRSEFDQLLLDNAREKGALVREETTVLELIREEQRVVGVRAQSRGGGVVEYRAPMTLDCSGKEAFCAVRNQWRIKDPKLNKIAVWTYYQGAQRDEGIDAGATTVAYVPEKGWFWYIPQHNDRISVGVVAEAKYLTRGGVKSPGAIFQREIGENQWIKQHLARGQQTGDYFLTSEYTHHSKHCGMAGLLLVGDAFAFLDPVFSSGVMLALKSGVLAGDAVHKAIVERDFSPERFAEYGRFMREGVENMRKLVYAFYDPKFSFRKLTDKYPDAVGSVTDCLSGDVNKDFSRLWRQIEEFVALPASLAVGKPLLAPQFPGRPMKTVLARYLEVYPGETERLRLLQNFLRGTTDPKQLFHRKNFAGHITASGFVLTPDGRKLALVNHKFLGRYLQPGGHVEETDPTVLAAALREVQEETDIRSCRHLPFHSDPLLPIDIDTHEIPANPKKNEPGHLHHDFRYLFRAESEVTPAARGRNGEGRWIWRPVRDAIAEETFKLVLTKLSFAHVA